MSEKSKINDFSIQIQAQLTSFGQHSCCDPSCNQLFSGSRLNHRNVGADIFGRLKLLFFWSLCSNRYSSKSIFKFDIFLNFYYHEKFLIKNNLVSFQNFSIQFNIVRFFLHLNFFFLENLLFETRRNINKQ